MKLSHKLLYVSNNPLPGKPKLQSSCVFPKSILTLYWAQLLRRLFPPFLCFAFYIVEVKVLSLVTCFNWIAVSSQRGRQGISSSARADQRPCAVAGSVSLFHLFTQLLILILDPDPDPAVLVAWLRCNKAAGWIPGGGRRWPEPEEAAIDSAN